MICKIVLLVWYDSLYKGLTKYCQGFGAENSPLAGFFCLSKAGRSWGLGMSNPQQVLPCIYRAELALHYATLTEHQPT